MKLYDGCKITELWNISFLFDEKIKYQNYLNRLLTDIENGRTFLHQQILTTRRPSSMVIARMVAQVRMPIHCARKLYINTSLSVVYNVCMNPHQPISANHAQYLVWRRQLYAYVYLYGPLWLALWPWTFVQFEHGLSFLSVCFDWSERDDVCHSCTQITSDQSKHRNGKLMSLHVYPMISLYPINSLVLKSK